MGVLGDGKPPKEERMTERNLYLLNSAATPLVVVRTADPINWVQNLPAPVATGARIAVVSWGMGRGFENVHPRRGGVVALGEAPMPDQMLEAFQTVPTGDPPTRLIVLAWNLLTYADNNPVTLQKLLDALPRLKDAGHSLVAIQPVGYQAKGLLASYAEYLDTESPNAADLASVGTKVMKGTPWAAEMAPATGEALVGLTLWQAEQAVVETMLSRRATPTFKDLLAAKEAVVNKHPALRLVTDTPSLEDVKGLARFKKFAVKCVRDPRSKGVLLLGTPGTGKTMVCGALAGASELPFIEFNLSAVFGSLVGQSEGNMRSAIDTIKSIGPCVLLVDEVEKALSGTKSSSATDGGTTERVAREFLMFLQNRPAGVYIVATCNDVTKLPPEYLRAERWDALFFVDLPSESERVEILNLYRKQYGLKDTSVTATSLDGWTGAEISTLCRLAAILGVKLSEAKQYVVPLSKTMKESIADLRKWARGRCVPASDESPVESSDPSPVTSGGRLIDTSVGQGEVN